MEETLREIKQLFFTYRNGALADTLKGAGHPCAVVFGLMIPQIADIARQQTPSLELAQRLWDDTGVRESRILATYGLFLPYEPYSFSTCTIIIGPPLAMVRSPT